MHCQICIIILYNSIVLSIEASRLKTTLCFRSNQIAKENQLRSEGNYRLSCLCAVYRTNSFYGNVKMQLIWIFLRENRWSTLNILSIFNLSQGKMDILPKLRFFLFWFFTLPASQTYSHRISSFLLNLFVIVELLWMERENTRYKNQHVFSSSWVSKYTVWQK